MVGIFRRITGITIAVAMFISMTGVVALAVDPPKWVAAMYVAGQNVVGLRWMPVAGATGYKVFRSTASGKDYQVIKETATPQHLDDQLEPGSQYFYVLQAVAGAEVSAYSEEKLVATPGEKKIEKVGPPTWKQLQAQETVEFGKSTFKVGLQWYPPAGGTVIAYNVYRSTVSGKDYALLSSTQTAEYVDAAVEANKTYYYVLSALDGTFQETPYSEEKSVLLKPAERQERARKKKKEKIKIVPRPVKMVSDLGLDVDLYRPFDVTGDNKGNIYIAEANVGGQGRLVIIRGTEIVAAIKPFQEKRSMITGVSITPDGDILVSDREAAAVHLFDSSGSLLKTFTVKKPKGENFKDPMISDAVQIGEEIFVTDMRNNCIIVLNAEGEVLRSFGELGNELGQFRAPTSIGVNSEGQLVIAQGPLNRIDFYTTDGEYLSSFGGSGGEVGKFGRIGFFSISSDGHIWVSDQVNNVIQEFDGNGKFLSVLSNEKGDGPAPIAPTGVFVDLETKLVYVPQSIANNVRILEMGNIIEEGEKK